MPYQRKLLISRYLSLCPPLSFCSAQLLLHIDFSLGSVYSHLKYVGGVVFCPRNWQHELFTIQCWARAGQSVRVEAKDQRRSTNNIVYVVYVSKQEGEQQQQRGLVLKSAERNEKESLP